MKKIEALVIGICIFLFIGAISGGLTAVVNDVTKSTEVRIVAPVGGLELLHADPPALAEMLALQNTPSSTIRISVDKAWACGTASTTKTHGFGATFISVTNDGSVQAFIDFALTAATTDDYPLAAGETFTLPIPINYSHYTSCITAASSTTIRFLAAR